MLNLSTDQRRRRPSLTPMIDVVFLLLVFFMLAAKLGPENVLSLSLAGSGTGEWSGPPRLVTVEAGPPLLNGLPTTDLASDLVPLMAVPTDPILVRPGPGASTQRLAEILSELRKAGLTNLVILEAAP